MLFTNQKLNQALAMTCTPMNMRLSEDTPVYRALRHIQTFDRELFFDPF